MKHISFFLLFLFAACFGAELPTDLAKLNTDTNCKDLFAWVVAEKDFSVRAERLDALLKHFRQPSYAMIFSRRDGSLLTGELNEWNRITPDPLFYNYALGILALARNHSGCLTYFEKAHKLAPENQIVSEQLARGYSQFRVLQKADALYTALLAKNPSRPIEEGAAVFYMSTGFSEQYEDLLRRLTQQPESLNNPFVFANALILDSRYDLALKLLRPLATKKEAGEELLYHAAFAEALAGNNSNAVEFLVRTLTLPVPAKSEKKPAPGQRQIPSPLIIRSGIMPSPTPQTALMNTALRLTREQGLSNLPLENLYQKFLPVQQFQYYLPQNPENIRIGTILLLNKILHEKRNEALRTQTLSALKKNLYASPEFLLSLYGTRAELRQKMEEFSRKGPDKALAAAVLMSQAQEYTTAELRAILNTLDWKEIEKSELKQYFWNAPGTTKGSKAEKEALLEELFLKLPPKNDSDMATASMLHGMLSAENPKSAAIFLKHLKKLSTQTQNNWQLIPFYLKTVIENNQTEVALELLEIMNSTPPVKKEDTLDFAALAISSQVFFEDTPFRGMLFSLVRTPGNFNAMPQIFRFPPLYLDGISLNMALFGYSNVKVKRDDFWKESQKLQLKPMLRLTLALFCGQQNEALKLAGEYAADPKASPLMLLNLAVFYLSENMDRPAYILLSRVLKDANSTPEEKTVAATLLLAEAANVKNVPVEMRDNAVAFLKQHLHNIADRAALAGVLRQMKLPMDPVLAAAAQFPEFFRNSSYYPMPNNDFHILLNNLNRPGKNIAAELLPFLKNIYMEAVFSSRTPNNYYFSFYMLEDLANNRQLFAGQSAEFPALIEAVSKQKGVSQKLIDFELACCYEYITNEPDKAIGMYQKVLRSDPKNLLCLRNLFMLSLEKDPETAIQCFRKIRLVSPAYAYSSMGSRQEAFINFVQTVLERWSDDPASLWYLSSSDFQEMGSLLSNLNGMTQNGNMYLPPLSGWNNLGNTKTDLALQEKRLAVYKKLCGNGLARPDLASAALTAKLQCYTNKEADREIYLDILKVITVDRNFAAAPFGTSNQVLLMLSSYLFQSKSFDEFRKFADSGKVSSPSMKKNLLELADFCEQASSADAAGLKKLLKSWTLSSDRDRTVYNGHILGELKSALLAQAFKFAFQRGIVFNLLELQKEFLEEISGPVEEELIRQHLARKDDESVRKYIRLKLTEMKKNPNLFSGPYFSNVQPLLAPYRNYSKLKPFPEIVLNELLSLTPSADYPPADKLGDMVVNFANAGGDSMDLKIVFENSPLLKELNEFDYFIPVQKLAQFFQTTVLYRSSPQKNQFIAFLKAIPKKTFGQELVLILSDNNQQKNAQALVTLFESHLEELQKADQERVRKLLALSDMLIDQWAIQKASRWSSSEFVKKSPRLYAFFRTLNAQEDLRQYQALMKEQPSNLFEFNQRAIKLIEPLLFSDREKALKLFERIQELNAADPNSKMHLGNLLWNTFNAAKEPLTLELTDLARRNGKEPLKMAELFAENLADHPFMSQHSAFFYAMLDYYIRRQMTDRRDILAERLKRSDFSTAELRPMLDYAAPETIVFLLETLPFNPGKMPESKTLKKLSPASYKRLDSMIEQARVRNPKVFLSLAVLKESDPLGPDPDNEDSDYSGHVEGVIEAIEKSALSAKEKNTLLTYLKYNCRECAAKLEKKDKK